MWRILTYPLITFAFAEALVIGVCRAANHWLGLTIEPAGAVVPMVLMGLASLIAGVAVGNEAQEYAHQQERISRDDKLTELKIEAETERQKIEAEKERFAKLEQLVGGSPDADHVIAPQKEKA